MDSMQFADPAEGAVEDAALAPLCEVQTSPDKANARVCLLCLDLSSVVNTGQLLLEHLCDLSVSSSLVLWVSEFLRE